MEAQFQTALDRLIETNSGAAGQPPSNTDVTNEMEQKEDMATLDPDDLHYYKDSKPCQTSSAMLRSHDNGYENTEDKKEGCLLRKSTNCAEQHQESYCKQQPSCTTDNQEEFQLKLPEYRANYIKECKSKVLASPINDQQEYCKRISEGTVTIQQDHHKDICGLPVVESTTENSLEAWQEQICRTSNKERDQKPLTHSRYQYVVTIN